VSILHIAHSDDWERALLADEYRWSSRGRTLDEQGFIHASTSEQVARVASAFYADDTQPLVVLVLDEAAIAESGVEVRYEDGGEGELFPHIYGHILPAWVTEVRPARFADGAFAY
jgi:glutathione S-transferase